MAIWKYEQNFNSLNDGNIVGQDSWTEYSATAIEGLVGDYTPYEGAKCLKASNPDSLVYPNSYNYYRREVSCVSGRFYVAIKMNLDDDTNAYVTVQNTSPLTNLIEIELYREDGVGKIYCWNNDGEISVDTGLRYEDGSWFILGIDFNNVENRFSLNKNNGEWAGNYAQCYPGYPEDFNTPMTLLSLGAAVTNNTSAVYFDDIKRMHFGPFPASFNE